MFPQKTIPAFESAISKGADGIELDVHYTTDQELVVHHFFNLGHTDNGKGIVCEQSLAELKSLDTGNWFKKQGHVAVSHEWIYQHVYADKRDWGRLT